MNVVQSLDPCPRKALHNFILVSLFLASLPAAPLQLKVDISPEPEQLSYTPADGSSFTQNPPPFIWVPAPEDPTYTLQISRSSDFDRDVLTIEGIEITTHTLRKPLDKGRWFWRYGVEEEQVIFSRARGFEIAEDAKDWVLPDIDEILSYVPKSHPRLFILRDEVGSYRYRAKFGDLKDLCLRLIQECDEHIGEHLIEEPPTPKGQGRDLGEFSGQIIKQARRYPIQLSETFGLAYLLTGNEKYALEAKRRILHFTSWDPLGSTSLVANDDISSRILFNCLRGYDWTYDFYNDGERKKIEEVFKIKAGQLFKRLRYESKYHTRPYRSHLNRWPGFLGEACLFFAHDWPEVREWLEYDLKILWNIYPVWGKEDGGWHEGPSYWTAYMNFILHFIVALEKTTGVNLLEKPFFSNTPYFILYSNPPYAKMSPFGDSEPFPPNQGRGSLMYQFSTLSNDPYIRGYANAMGSGSGTGVLGFVLKNDRLQGWSPSSLPHARYFPGVGLVSLHTDFGDEENDIHFLFHSDPYGAVSHSHADQNAFTLEAFGEALAIASGYRTWHGSPHHNAWSRQTKSSNAITIKGGEGQQRGPEFAGRIVKFESTDVYDYILGDATSAYDGLLTHSFRHVVHIRPGVFVILDDLKAPNSVLFDWWLHSLSEMEVDESKGQVLIEENNTRLEISLLFTEDLEFHQFSDFPVPPEGGEKDQWHLRVSTTESAANTQFLSVLVPYKEGEKPLVKVAPLINRPEESGVVITVGKTRYELTFLPVFSLRKRGPV